MLTKNYFINLFGILILSNDISSKLRMSKSNINTKGMFTRNIMVL